jgi:wobble nucleotide-excising tRNase
MEENEIKELIQEYEQMLSIIQNRLNRLKFMLGSSGKEFYTTTINDKSSVVPRVNVQQEIEKHRSNLASRIKEIKSDAQRQISDAVSNANKVSSGVGSNVMPTMPNIPGVMGNIVSIDPNRKKNKKTNDE